MPAPTLLRPCPLELVVGHDDDPTARPRQRDGLVRVRRGVYAPRAEWTALAPWERYLTRVHALALVRPGTLFCLESAAALTALPIFGEPRDIHVFDQDAARSRRFGDVVVHTSVDPRRIVQNGSLATTAIAETAVDLLRVLPPAFALAVADAAIAPNQIGATSVEAMQEIAARQVNPRGIRRVEWALTRADARAESPGESVSRAVIEWLGYPPPVLQQTFGFEGVDDRGDFFWPREDVLGESDGYGKYDATDAEASKRIFIAEKLREDRLRRYVRSVARWDWGDAMRATPLQAKLAQAGLVAERPLQHAMLATLRSHPRSYPAAGR